MNKQLLISFAIFATGACVGFLIGKKVCEEKYAQLAQEEIDSVKEFLKVKHEAIAKDISAGLSEGIKDGQKIQRMGSGMTRSSLDGTYTDQYSQAKAQYGIASPGRDNEFRDAAGMTEADMNIDPSAVYHERDLSDVDRSAPYLIDDREYTDEFEHHDKITLYYYRVDDVLCEENEEIIDEVEETVGFDALSKLEMQTSVWVRNEPISTDYEIISLNKSYAETVYRIGVEENLSPREKYIRDIKKRQETEE